MYNYLYEQEAEFQVIRYVDCEPLTDIKTAPVPMFHRSNFWLLMTTNSFETAGTEKSNHLLIIQLT